MDSDRTTPGACEPPGGRSDARGSLTRGNEQVMTAHRMIQDETLRGARELAVGLILLGVAVSTAVLESWTLARFALPLGLGT